MRTIRLAPGFRLELVASEPMVQDPVALAFDEDGGLFVVEMRGFMPDVDGNGENAPVGRISRLEDTDGDGRMDRSAVFADGLVLPRALAPTRGGLLYVAGGKLFFGRDTDGDGRADATTEIDPRYSTTISALEHEPNGLLLALDNWYYNAKSTARYRMLDGRWIRENTEFRGQWGISQDDHGRLFYNVNSSQLHADLVPPNTIGRNPNYESFDGLNHRLTRDQRLFTLRLNTGVNRAYQPNVLDERGHLREFTSACAPLIYRGDQYPPDFAGNAFVCEPAANLIKRNLVVEGDLTLSARFAYEDSEFIASTDERFRPVNLALGPDGNLYIADMYRGIIQHRNYVTSHLRREILSRELDKPLNLGRIYRVVDAGETVPARPRPRRLSTAPVAEWVELLGHASGWWRDTAQRLLVERGGSEAVLRLVRVVETHPNPLARIHALWTLEGLGAGSDEALARALAAPEPKVRVAALRVLDGLARRGVPHHEVHLPVIRERLLDPVREVRLHAVYSLGYVTDSRVFPDLLAVCHRERGEKLFLDAILCGLQGRELDFLEFILRHEPPGGRQTERLIQSLASAVSWERQPGRVARLLGLAAEESAESLWRGQGILAGILENAGDFAESRIRLEARPAALDPLLGSADSTVRTRAERIEKLLTWPGSLTEAIATPTSALSAGEQASFERGRELYPVVCAACHGLEGQGLPALAPPLVRSEWVTGPPNRTLAIVLGGMEGPVTVKGRLYEPPLSLKEMPTLGGLSDEQIADVLTYLRRTWGHAASPVAVASVADFRQRLGDRAAPFTEAELLKIE